MIDAKKLQTVLDKNTIDGKKKLSSVRSSIDEINNEIYWLEESPLPLSDAVENITEYVKDNSKQDGIEHFFFSKGLGAKKIFESRLRVNHGEMIAHEHGMVKGSGVVDIAQTICSLFGVEIEKKLQKIAIAASKNIESGPPLSERPQLKEQLIKERRMLEIEEEMLISTAEDLGLSGFFRRADCNPEIVLMIEE